MRLFKRKQSNDERPVRCPNCDERVPDGARECAMCGHSVADVVDRLAPGKPADAGGAGRA